MSEQPDVTGPAGAGSQHPLGSAPAPDGLQILPVRGLPEFRPGDNLVGAIAHAAPWLADGDVLVVTSKVVSKTEGMLVPSPTDPEQRDELRRRLIDEQTVRLVAQVARTKIVENRLGIIAAAAGIDASNVNADEIALLPEDPDASAEQLVLAFADRGIRIGVVITDTQGRAWRNGVTDVTIGAAGVLVLDDLRGGIDDHGNELVVTMVGLGDEMAAAADLVKGKLTGVPVAVLRGMDAPGLPADGSGPRGGGRTLIRPRDEDLFRLGTDLALAQGRQEAVRLRPDVAMSDEPVDPVVLSRAVGAAAGAGAGVGAGVGAADGVASTTRFVWVREHADTLRQAVSGTLQLDGDPLPGTELLMAFATSADLPAISAGGAAVQAVVTALAAEGLAVHLDYAPTRCPIVVRTVLFLPSDWEPLGAIGVGHPERPFEVAGPEDGELMLR